MSIFVAAALWLGALFGINRATQLQECAAYHKDQQQQRAAAGEQLTQAANFPQGHLEIYWQQGSPTATADAYAVEDEAPNSLYKKVGECTANGTKLYHYQGKLPVVVQKPGAEG